MMMLSKNGCFHYVHSLHDKVNIGMQSVVVVIGKLRVSIVTYQILIPW